MSVEEYLEPIPVVNGPAGYAQKVPINPLRLKKPDHLATLAAWLIYAPNQSPAWSHYLLAVIHLRDIPGVKPAEKDYPEAEYEMLVAALNPDHHPNVRDVETFRFLTPINHRSQFHGISDEQAVDLAALCASAVVDGRLPAEPALSTGGGSDPMWERAIQATLAHFRGEHG